LRRAGRFGRYHKQAVCTRDLRESAGAWPFEIYCKVQMQHSASKLHRDREKKSLSPLHLSTSFTLSLPRQLLSLMPSLPPSLPAPRPWAEVRAAFVALGLMKARAFCDQCQIKEKAFDRNIPGWRSVLFDASLLKKLFLGPSFGGCGFACALFRSKSRFISAGHS
jgi:hypothetical protein